ncbi:MAG TPA: endonuclease/exonuclease/phosphatase family protein [Acetobacteraceae bacterium]|jgi:exonuclease III|nr:endonuclease/exonuclease/phosphatase family protein [Acetobacteraceae bacterium]
MFVWTVAMAAAVLLLLPAVALGAQLKIASWNLNWLTDRPANDPDLPKDVQVRNGADFDLLRQYAAQLNADVIAIQEVDGRAVAARLFPADHYSIYMTHDDVVQRVGIVVRRGLAYDVNPDVTALDVDRDERLRSGADITLHLGAARLRILAVHLKTGCHEASLYGHPRRSCVELREQIRPLQAWISARQQEGVPFLVLGDFNRDMDRGKDQLWSALQRAAPLVRATEGYSSPCWGGDPFIDHIIAGGAARDWMDVATLKVLTYRETGEEWKDRLSDHCPVSVLLRVPAEGSG